MERLRRFLDNKTHVPTQFVKYGLAGGFGATTYALTFTVLNETVLPADTALAASERGWNFFAANGVAFVLATFVAYLANKAWVFQPGRHDRWRELAYFYLVAFVGFIAGTPLGSYIVARLAINEYMIFGFVVVASTLVNFLGRKYFVFLH